MSTKTVALESSVYERLARAKRPSESFTRVIDRLLTAHAHARGTCAQAVADAAEIWGKEGNELRDAEADLMERVIADARKNTDWTTEECP
jgi:predicted CopG family antitoxin